MSVFVLIGVIVAVLALIFSFVPAFGADVVVKMLAVGVVLLGIGILSGK